MSARRVVLLVAGALALGPARPASATVHRLTDCGDTGGASQLRATIENAAFGDTILLPECVITLSGPAGEDANAGGDLDIPSGLRLVIRGTGVQRTILDGGQVDRVLHLQPGSHVTLAAVSVRNGRTPDDGAGIHVEALATLELAEAEVSGNIADGLGGGIFSLGRLLVRESTVAGNLAFSGGGLGMDGAAASATVERSTISGNGGTPGGGGLVNMGGRLLLDQSTVSGNTGAGVLTGSNQSVILHSTITGNTRGVTTSMATTLVRSSIVAGNPPADCDGDVVITSAGFNLQGDGSCGFAGSGDLTATDPGLGTLADNGGPTLTHLPRSGSPVLEGASGTGCPPLDQRLRPRPAPGPAGLSRCDIGAVERQGVERNPPSDKLVDPR